MLPFSFLAAFVGGKLNEDAGLLRMQPPISPMSHAGLAFGVVTAIAGLLVIPSRRSWLLPLIPVASLTGFGITGLLMDRANARLMAGGSVSMLVLELCLSGLAGMTMIAVSLWLASLLTITSAVRFALIGTFFGALCVVVVNTKTTLVGFTLAVRLYCTMFLWHFLMLQYLAWLNASQRSNKASAM